MKTLLLAAIFTTAIAGAEPIPSSEAAKHVGETVELRGIVADVRKSDTGMVLLSLGAKFPKQDATLIIPKSAVASFGKLEELKGAEIVARGEIKPFKDKPKIKITDPAKLQIVKKAASPAETP